MLSTFLNQHLLPASFINNINRWLAPLINSIMKNIEHAPIPPVVCISGCQGSGKSTLAEYIAIKLSTELNITSTILSLDDFYLPKKNRLFLAKNIHPLLKTFTHC